LTFRQVSAIIRCIAVSNFDLRASPAAARTPSANKKIMVIIRLKRIGKKHQAAFRFVVGERRSKLKGDYTEDIGYYNPHSKKVEVKADRVKYWLSVGSQMSPTVQNLLIQNKIIEGKKVANHKQPEKSAEGGSASGGKAPAAPVAKAA
jgi:small subunit ribosomal protein S16